MKVSILKDGHSISDFKSEKEALQWFADNEGFEIAFEPVEYILCAAVHYDNGLKYKLHDKFGIETGFVIAGWRHPYVASILPTNPYYIKNLFDKEDKEGIQKYEELNVKYGWQEESLTRCETVQGFLTNTGRFVNRKEAFEIALNAGQITEDCGYCGELFSEDLY